MLASMRVCLLLLALLSVLGSAGCAVVGPPSIRSDRAAYNDAIVATNNQQVLAMIVRMRYGEPSGLLAVSSVTANVRIKAKADAEFGLGKDGNYEGNLVPLGAGFAYEENPTISYTPVQGEKYMRQFFAPMPLDLTVLLLSALRDSPHAMTLLVRSINGMPNPDFLWDPSVDADPRFARLAELLAEMARQGRVTWAQESGSDSPFALAITSGAGAPDRQLAELFGLLGFAAPDDLDGVITLPVGLGIGRAGEPAIRLETRSLFDLFQIAAASVEVPEEHVESGMAHRLPPPGPVGRSIQIRRSRDRPDGAVVAGRHHGWWYSIDGTDAASKLTFRIVESLISVRIADTVNHLKTTPVLTVPVAR
jgi:hypothetical protein